MQLANSILSRNVQLDRFDRKVIQKQIDHWLETHATKGGEDAQFELIVEYSGHHDYLCRAHFKVAGHEWIGQNSGRSPQDAAVRTLKHLHERHFVSAS